MLSAFLNFLKREVITSWMTGAFDNFLYLVSVLSTGFLTVFSVKSEIREDTKPTKNVDLRLGTKNSFLNAYA